jgi:hypothetical protein
VGTTRCDPTTAMFRFTYPKSLMRFDVYNPTDREITVKMRAPELRQVTFTVQPGALQRIKTGWRNRASAVSFESDGLASLRFDNLAYSSYLWTQIDWSE